MNLVSVHTASEICDLVRTNEQVRVAGGGSKSALAPVPADKATVLDLRPLTGIVEYDPGEYTFTALAGTPMSEIIAKLAEHGQYLPFDPLLAERGATLGGTVAAGISGPGRQRYGGVRDFVIGVRFVDGNGQLVRGGGKVVKNAAGFDLPKLLVGSLGRLGVLAEISCKVFPQPPSYATLRVSQPSVAAAVETIGRLAAQPFDLEALEYVPHDAPHTAALYIRLGGPALVLPERIEQLRSFLASGTTIESETMTAETERSFWLAASNFQWLPANSALIKVPMTLQKIGALEALLPQTLARRYSSAGNLAWLTWPGALTELDDILKQVACPGVLVIASATSSPWLGVRQNNVFARRIKQALDPENKFGDL